MKRPYKRHPERSHELLDVAQTLFYGRGYDATTISDIISAAGVSKGAFYHHFRSKEEILNSLVDRIVSQIFARIGPIVDDASIPAIEKLHRMAAAGRGVKLPNKELLKAYLRVMYREENLALRVKLNEKSRCLAVAAYTAVIGQGVAEGVFSVTSPEIAAEIVVGLFQSMPDSLVRMFADIDDHPEYVDIIDKTIDQYEIACERILGAPARSLDLVKGEHIEAFRANSGSRPCSGETRS